MEKKNYDDILKGCLEEIQSYEELSITVGRTPEWAERIEVRDLVNKTISVIIADSPVEDVLQDIENVARKKLEEIKETQGFVTLNAVELTNRLKESARRLSTEDRFRTISGTTVELINKCAFVRGYTVEEVNQSGAKINAILSLDKVKYVISICIAEYLDTTKSIKTINLISKEIHDRILAQFNAAGTITR